MILFGLILYLIIMLIIGVLSFGVVKSMEDFLLGGRRLPSWVIAISERASGESAWFILGLPGLAYSEGLSAFWAVFGCAVGIFLSWSFVAPRLREYSAKFKALTIPDYLEERFQDSTHILRLLSLIIIVFFYTIYVSAQFMGAGKVLNATFGTPPLIGMMIGGFVIILYTLLGGFFAVCWTDLIQGILMALAAVGIPIVGIVVAGGWNSINAKLMEINPWFLDITHVKGTLWAVIIGELAIGLGYFGQPHLLVRYMALKSHRDMKQGRLVALIWVLLAYWGAPFIGLMAVALLKGVNITDPEHVMPLMAKQLLPGWLAGLVISAAIAAMMSTADSELLVASSGISRDIYHKIFNREAGKKKLLLISRLATVLIGIVAFLLAIFVKELIFWFVLYAWAGLGASFGPVILLSLWYKRMNKWGALAGMITGTLTVIVWHNIKILHDFIYELLPAFILSIVVIIIVSELTSRKR